MMPLFNFFLRCLMHSLSLLMGSILSHDMPKAVIAEAQAIVTYFRHSQKATDALSMQATRLLLKRRGLVSANSTRFTSVWGMLQSLVELCPAVRSVDTMPDQYKPKKLSAHSVR
jgi:hypothetical protein